MRKYWMMILFIVSIFIETAVDWFDRNIVKRFLKTACVDKIYSVSVVVGSDQCNANCKHCGGKVLRHMALDANKGTVKNLKSALVLCHKYGGWTVSFTGSGEPLLSPDAITRTLEEVRDQEDKGIVFPFLNLFTNGIELVRNPRIKEFYLSKWRRMGLTSVVVSIHDVDHEKNAKAYGVSPKDFPRLEEIIKTIRDADLTPRIVLLLNKGYCDNLNDFLRNLDAIKKMGVFMVTSWHLCNNDGTANAFTPDLWELFKIRLFLWSNCQKVFNQVWGGGVYNYHGLSVRVTTYVSEHKPTNDFIRQLVVFQDGTMSYSWFQEGFHCQK
jgi:MoaA/NifB/PqqE/SkfB family radical SAM enzyme